LGLTIGKGNAALQLLHRISFGVFMSEIVDRVLETYELTRELDAERLAQSREKTNRYIDKLTSAGQNDASQLAVYALAYLKELHEGRDPRFTGC
jgi:hypothetical protein